VRRAALLPALVAAAFLVVATPSCSAHDVTLATLPSGDDGSGPPPPPRCASTGDCPAGTYCDKVTCGDPSGTCLLPPIECDDSEKPVCGCDGVTYFNQCLRQRSSIASDTPDPCRAPSCGGPSGRTCDEGAGQLCALLGGMGPDHCSPMAEGSCWVLPAQCPPANEATNFWDSCPPSSQHCVPTCDAIRAGGPYLPSPMCP
jgi:hypothetical protein